MCALTINSICSNIEIYPIKLFNDEGRGSSLNLLNVLKKLLYSDIKVINIAASFSSGLYDEDISKVCESLKNKGKILVASNYNTDKRISYLASMKSVIGVGNLENAYFDHQFIFNRSNDIQLKGNNRVCFYCIDDQVELFGKNSRLSCVISAFISNILLDKGDLAFEEIEDSLENISKINEKKTFCHESEYKTEYKEYYDELLEMQNTIKYFRKYFSKFRWYKDTENKNLETIRESIRNNNLFLFSIFSQLFKLTRKIIIETNKIF